MIDQEVVTGLQGDQVRTAVALHEVGAEHVEKVWFAV